MVDLLSVYATTLYNGLWLGQVQDVDDEQGRLQLSLRPSDLKLTHQMDMEEASPLIINRFHSYLQERDSVLAGVVGSSSVKSELSGGRTVADLVHLFQPGGCVSGHVTSLAEETVIIELTGGVVGRASVGTAGTVHKG